jgi:hypothetical protein
MKGQKEMAKIPLSSDAEARAEDAFERFGTREPHCRVPNCPVSDQRQITGDDDEQLICYEHRAEQQGRSPIEDQHPAGRHNDAQFTVPFTGNLHRAMDDGKKDWPTKTLLNPDGSPALKAAACVRATGDWLLMIVGCLLGWVALFLEWLDERLTDLHGRRWWEELGLPEQFAAAGLEAS